MPLWAAPPGPVGSFSPTRWSRGFGPQRQHRHQQPVAAQSRGRSPSGLGGPLPRRTLCCRLFLPIRKEFPNPWLLRKRSGQEHQPPGSAASHSLVLCAMHPFRSWFVLGSKAASVRWNGPQHGCPHNQPLELSGPRARAKPDTEKMM